MTADRAVFYSCIALWAVAMLVGTDQWGGVIPMPASNSGEVSRSSEIKSPVKPDDSRVVSPSLTASDLAALFSRCVTSAMNEEGPDVAAFVYTDPHTEKVLAIHCDAVRPVKVVNLERRYVP